MKRVWIPLMVVLLIGCATPATVKQAIKQQSEAYTDLQASLREFNRLYGELNAYQFSLNQKSRLRFEALAMATKLSGAELGPRTKQLNPLAHEDAQAVENIARILDTSPPSRAEVLRAIDQSIRFLQRAFVHGEEESRQSKEDKEIRKTLKGVDVAYANAMREIRALMVMHDAVAEYFGIDLTPEAKALKEAISNIKAIGK